MIDVKEKILADAIKISFEYSRTIIRLKRIIFAMGVVIFGLIIGYLL